MHIMQGARVDAKNNIPLRRTADGKARSVYLSVTLVPLLYARIADIDSPVAAPLYCSGFKGVLVSRASNFVIITIST